MEPWLPHGLSITGLEPRFISAELTLVHLNPAMAELIPPATVSESCRLRQAIRCAIWKTLPDGSRTIARRSP